MIDLLKKYSKIYLTLIVGLISLGVIVSLFSLIFLVIGFLFKVVLLVILLWIAMKLGKKIIK